MKNGLKICQNEIFKIIIYAIRPKISKESRKKIQINPDTKSSIPAILQSALICLLNTTCQTLLGNSFSNISITRGSATPTVTAFFVFCCKISIYNPVGAFLRLLRVNLNRSETHCLIQKPINNHL